MLIFSSKSYFCTNHNVKVAFSYEIGIVLELSRHLFSCLTRTHPSPPRPCKCFSLKAWFIYTHLLRYLINRQMVGWYLSMKDCSFFQRLSLNCSKREEQSHVMLALKVIPLSNIWKQHRKVLLFIYLLTPESNNFKRRGMFKQVNSVQASNIAEL